MIFSKRIIQKSLGLAVFFLAVSCASETLPKVELLVGSVTFQTEVATTSAQREKGLMYRKEMDEKSAMIFVFPDEMPRIFWMKDTPLPLSIAYISKSGVVKEILDMEAFSLAPVPSQHSVMYALEVRQGAFGRLGVKIGDQVDLTVLKNFRQVRK